MKHDGTNRTRPADQAGPTVGHSLAQRFAALLLVLAVLLGLNFHLFLLQVAGWAGMVADYREESGSWLAAVQQTAAGDDPCDLCRQVESALTSLRSGTESVASGNELRLLPILLLPLGHPVSPAPPPPTAFVTLAALSEKPGPYVSCPEPPPPRRSV